ncbi:MAG: DUF5686 and carboxypeptidase regulatory-like domain-containing protein [Bacteroidota bacterium]|nr:DUF5686 and carboxypeptidase regulatory-like domain-containing protein [Bacteroidota bacterium]MDX5430985.1 DUF5686 and carboxypeptidase regulatory-like domain-containing protein [Bacteroidota bacterium]MDX5469736.1 DUF5686 and carboxypeptidase regulatory-like domain-containing protein [Bacteroidota bacterium]
MRILLSVFLFCASFSLFAQKTEVNGKVTDATSGEALPFVNIYFKGTTIGVTTDFDGFYTIETDQPIDSISASYLGYITVSKKVQKGKKQTIHFQLQENLSELPEAVVRPGENPAHRIIKAAQKNRQQNSYENLKAYQYESFTKVQIAIDHLTEKQRKSKLLNSVMPLFDTIGELNDGSNTAVLPIFISETLSEFYTMKNPFRQKEIIKATRVIGVGMEDESVTAQILGSTFQQYNFHLNWIRILEKDFASPVGDAALDLYVFTLKDSTYIDGIKCYRIELNPKRPSDLVFTGTIWIADSSFAIRRSQLFMDHRANLNFIDQFKIQQEYVPTESGAWVPSKTRILLNLDEPSTTTPGFIALFYVSNKNIVVNQEKDPKFYEEKLKVEEGATEKDEGFWEENRHEKLTDDDKKVIQMIDTLNNLPIVKTWVEWVNIIVNGYKRVGKIDIGPYAYLYSYNPLEGHRFTIGAKTNYLWSETFQFRARVAYGTRDQRFKYMVQGDVFLSKKHWTVIGLKQREEVEQIGVTDQSYDQTNLFTTFALFQAVQMNRTNEQTFYAFRQYSPSWSQRVVFQRKQYMFEPVGDRFNFAFFQENTPTATVISSAFRTTTLTIDTRFAYQEQWILNHNERYSLGAQKGPSVNLTYTHGFKDLLQGDFSYDKVGLTIQQWVRMGRLGEGTYIITAGKVFADSLPYPILDVQRGNQSILANRYTFNLMNLFEFVSDQYVAVNYEQHFGGAFFNRIPLVKKAKLRFFMTGKSVWGSVSQKHVDLLPTQDSDSRPVTQFYQLNREPYVEFGYGVENIFSFGRIDFIHRVTHLDNPGINRFGVKISGQLTF